MWAATQVGWAHWQVGGSSSRPNPLVGGGGEPGRWVPRGTHVSQAPERGVGAATLEGRIACTSVQKRKKNKSALQPTCL
jgi:hypothetical protein